MLAINTSKEEVIPPYDFQSGSLWVLPNQDLLG